MDDLLTAYSERFGVDLAGYLWYFHTGEEGCNIGGLFYPPPNAQVQQISITLGMLHEFAQQGRWAVEYPEPGPPRSRPDLQLNNRILLGLIFLVGLALVVRACVS